MGLDDRFANLLPEVLIGLGLEEFAALAFRALEPKPVLEVSFSHLHAPAVSVKEQAFVVVERLRRTGTMTFRALCGDAPDTITKVARFLALLELFREGAVAFDQVSALAELTVRWTGAEEGEIEIDDEFDNGPHAGESRRARLRRLGRNPPTRQPTGSEEHGSDRGKQGRRGFDGRNDRRFTGGGGRSRSAGPTAADVATASEDSAAGDALAIPMAALQPALEAVLMVSDQPLDHMTLATAVGYPPAQVGERSPRSPLSTTRAGAGSSSGTSLGGGATTRVRSSHRSWSGSCSRDSRPG